MSLERQRLSLLEDYLELAKAAVSEELKLEDIVNGDLQTVDPTLSDIFSRNSSVPLIYRAQTPVGEFTYDPESRIATSPLLKPDEKVQLTAKEGVIFGEIMSHPLRVTTYRRLEEAFSEERLSYPYGSLKSHITHIRHKLGVERVQNTGFRLLYVILDVGYSLQL